MLLCEVQPSANLLPKQRAEHRQRERERERGGGGRMRERE